MAEIPRKSSAQSPAQATPARGGKTGPGGELAALLSDPFRLLLILAVNAALVVGIVSTAVILHSRKPPPKPPTLAAALDALDHGKAADAQRMAETLANQDLTSDDWGGPDFIFGSLAAETAEAAEGKQRIESFHLASLYLARSRERGFPPGRQAAGLYLLGKALFRCGRSNEAVSAFEEALPQNAPRADEIRAMLIEAYLGVQPPQYPKALAENQKRLSDPHLAKSDRNRLLIQQAEILLGMDRRKECAAIVEKLSGDPSLRGDIALLRGRLALAEGQAQKSQDRIRAAMQEFRKALGERFADIRIARQANYLLGLCQLQLGDLLAALNQMNHTARLFADSPEALAAWRQQAEIARRLGRHVEAVLACQNFAAAFAQQDELHNPWVDRSQLSGTLLAACQEYLKAEKYETALLLGKLLVHFLPKVEAMQWTAQIYRTWGDNLMERAEHLPWEQAEKIRRQARTQYHRLGDCYTELARELYTSREYPAVLWEGAEAYRTAHDFQSSAALLRLYMRNESRLRRAQALVDLGEAELSLGHLPSALEAFQDCIQQHPRDVAVYRARLLASRAAASMGDAKQAESFLADNLNGDQLTPASKEWRDSLFALGEFLHDAARDREAIPRLDEALHRYPAAPQATLARYLLGDSSRRRAKELRIAAAKEISSVVRAEQLSESRLLLHHALDAYRILQNTLGRRTREDLILQDQALLRNARFAIGETYLELELYPEALRAYQSAANQYATSPEVLDAYMQIANVYRRMDRPMEARTSLEQARLALRRIPPGARFEQTTNYNRKQWGDLLDRLCSL